MASKQPAGDISIHAPARGATVGVVPSLDTIRISIHAPARGATPGPPGSSRGQSFQFTPLREGRRKVPINVSQVVQFQFTPLREGRRRKRGQQPELEPISIHAPARGATRAAGIRAPSSAYFNSRPCERGDIVAVNILDIHIKFQFTPLREGRRHFAEVHPRIAISIHAPARGATP